MNEHTRDDTAYVKVRPNKFDLVSTLCGRWVKPIRTKVKSDDEFSTAMTTCRICQKREAQL